MKFTSHHTYIQLPRIRSYSFNFNGQERDDEVYGAGNAYSFEYRVHDPRLGRFLSVDPLYRDYPWNSTYAFAENCVIRFVDLEGLETGDRGWSSAPWRVAVGNSSKPELDKWTADETRGMVMLTAPVAIIFIAATLPEWGPPAVAVGMRLLNTPAGKYIANRTKDAMIDLGAQLTANNFDFKKVDWIGVGSNYATPFKGKYSFIINNTIKNGIDAAADLTYEDGLTVIGGPDGMNKSLSNASIEFFVGELVDNLSGAYSSYLKENFKDMSESVITQKVKEWSSGAKEYFDELIKNELLKSAKNNNVKNVEDAESK